MNKESLAHYAGQKYKFIKTYFHEIFIEAASLLKAFRQMLRENASVSEKSAKGIKLIQETTLKFKIFTLALTIFISSFVLPFENASLKNIVLRDALISGEYFVVEGLKPDTKLLACKEFVTEKFKSSCFKTENGKCEFTMKNFKDGFLSQTKYIWSDTDNRYIQKPQSSSMKRALAQAARKQSISYKPSDDTFVYYYPTVGVEDGYKIIDGAILNSTEPRCRVGCNKDTFDAFKFVMQNIKPHRLCKNTVL